MNKPISKSELLSDFKLTSFHSIEDEIKDNYSLRRNLVTHRLEIKKADEPDSAYQEFTERIFNKLFCEIGKLDIKCTPTVFQAILNSDLPIDYDPFQEYFSQLKWDGETDYIKQLTDTVICTNQKHWHNYFKKWLVASVACCTEFKPNHQVLIFSGGQGIGKSTWLNRLIPKKLIEYRFTGTIDPHSKDSLINLAETMFINMDELDNLNKTEIGTLKSLITMDKIRIRRPYGRFSEVLERRSSFMGSINDPEFLTDTTGNRRYLCFAVEKINFLHDINMDDVFAQAYHLLKFGENGEPFRYWFDMADQAGLEENNQMFTRMTIEEELVSKYFRLPEEPEDEIFLTPTDIINKICSLEKHRILDQRNFKKLGQVLHKLGFKKKSTYSSKPYCLSYTETAMYMLGLL